ncbi:MAG: glycoside hydrolase family 73 protein [Bacteroidota bacterium]
MNPTKRVLTFLLMLVGLLGREATAQSNEKPSQKVLDYIEQFRSLAVEEMKRSGIPASITLAQGICESGAGSSRLAVEANNHFGIKCKKEWTGPTITHTDDHPNECFRKYSTAAESYRDHSDFLRSRPHYASLFLLDPLDYKGWAYGLKRAGYATSPTYPQSLLRVIELYQLFQYDQSVQVLPASPAGSSNE